MIKDSKIQVDRGRPTKSPIRLVTLRAYIVHRTNIAHPIIALESISPNLASSVRTPLMNIKPLVHHLFGFFFSFFLHTYLVWVAAIMKAVHHGLVPALHSAAEQAVQWSSGHWQASFLALFRSLDFSSILEPVAGGWRKGLVSKNLQY